MAIDQTRHQQVAAGIDFPLSRLARAQIRLGNHPRNAIALDHHRGRGEFRVRGVHDENTGVAEHRLQFQTPGLLIAAGAAARPTDPVCWS